MAEKEPTQITTLNQFIEWIDQLKEQTEHSNLGRCLFRGLSNKQHSIEASAWRRLTHEADRKDLERFLEINRGLINDARLYEHDRENGRELKDLEILAKLQHFRAATCLIDFTYSAQVALWFACQSSYRKPPNSEALADGKVCVIFDETSKIKQITPELLDEGIDYFFETNAAGMYPLYQWQPRQLNNRIFPQYSVFLFGGDRTIEPDIECSIAAGSKQKILASLEDFSQMKEATLFPDFEGFVYQRTQGRPYDVPDYKRRGYSAYQDGRYEAAIADYDEAIHRNPNDIEAYKLRGDAKVRLEQYSEAIADFDEAISRYPDNASAYHGRGAANYFLYQNEAAIADFSEAIRLNPNDRRSHKLRGDVKRDIGHFDEAREDYQKALELAQQADDTFLIASITPTLQEIDSLTVENRGWTPERFKALVPENLRDIYEDPNGSAELYSLGADLQSLIQEQEWELTLRFGVKHIFFFSGNIRLFGFNLFSTRPRFTFCGIRLQEARDIVPQYEFTPYPQYSQLVCQRGPTVTDLRPLFEFVYRNAMQLWEDDQEIVEALKHILEDYDYLEYDEEASRRSYGLRVKVTRLDADRDFSVTGHICRALGQATGRRFFVPGVVTHESQNWETAWRFFTIREWPLPL